jgi:trimethylamine--corrinoid protein Co-methyltransferase
MARGGIRRSGNRRVVGALNQLPWRQIVNPFAPLDVLRPEQLEAIRNTSMAILEELGIEVLSPRARALYRAEGATVDEASQMVRFDRAMIAGLVAKAPATFTLTPRDPARQLTIGGAHMCFGLVAGPPNVHDRVRGRRTASFQDYCDILRLAQSFNIIHLLGNQPVAPVDLPAATRHLDCYRANVTLTDRVYHCTAIGRERALDGIDMMAIARGIDREAMVGDPGVITIISINSPRRLDESMADGLMAMAEYGQAVCVTPFTLMGAMTPVTLAAALAQQNAEALAGIALVQAVRPGCPVVYGAFTSNVDMRSGAPAFGTPENVQATLAAGQLARSYGLPYRSSNANASNAPDVQAAYESQMSIWAAAMGHANILYHGAGWLEGGLTASFEKIVIDAEMLQGMAEVIKPIEVDESSLGLDAIREVQPGGHFFGSPHTLARYETAFYTPMLSDWRNASAWAEAGAVDATQRATGIWQELLAHYEAPAMPQDRAEALDAFVARRKETLSAAA